MEESRSKPTDAERGGRCVLVSITPPPAELMGALSRKQLDIREHRSVVTAMAEVMIHAREVKAGATRQPLVVLIVGRAEVPRADEFVGACTIYAPHAVAWTYDHGAEPPLRSYHASANGAPKPTPAVAPPAPDAGAKPRIFISSSPPPPQVTIVRRPSKPSLRLSGGDRAAFAEQPMSPARTESGAAPAPPDIPPPLTDEELRMLLSDDYDPTRGGPGGSGSVRDR